MSTLSLPSLVNIYPWADKAQQWIQICGGHEYFIPNKFYKYISNNSVVKADSVFNYIYSN